MRKAQKANVINAVCSVSVDDKTPRRISREEVYACGETIYHAGIRAGLCMQEAEDLVGSVAEKCEKNSKVIYNPSRATLQGFLYKVALNMARDILKVKPKLASYEEISENPAKGHLIEPEDESAEWEEEMERYAERKELLAYGIKEMYKRHSQNKVMVDAFLLFCRDGKSGKAAAEKLRVTERYVNVAVKRCKDEMRAILRPLMT